jgi:hypothetical protein
VRQGQTPAGLLLQLNPGCCKSTARPPTPPKDRTVVQLHLVRAGFLGRRPLQDTHKNTRKSQQTEHKGGRDADAAAGGVVPAARAQRSPESKAVTEGEDVGAQRVTQGHSKSPKTAEVAWDVGHHNTERKFCECCNEARRGRRLVRSETLGGLDLVLGLRWRECGGGGSVVVGAVVGVGCRRAAAS